MQTVVIVCNIRPIIEYESEVWEDNKSLAGSLESITGPGPIGKHFCRAPGSQPNNSFIIIQTIIESVDSIIESVDSISRDERDFH